MIPLVPAKAGPKAISRAASIPGDSLALERERFRLLYPFAFSRTRSNLAVTSGVSTSAKSSIS
jgi:hypothetical protein